LRWMRVCERWPVCFASFLTIAVSCLWLAGAADRVAADEPQAPKGQQQPQQPQTQQTPAQPAQGPITAFPAHPLRGYQQQAPPGKTETAKHHKGKGKAAKISGEESDLVELMQLQLEEKRARAEEASFRVKRAEKNLDFVNKMKSHGAFHAFALEEAKDE